MVIGVKVMSENPLTGERRKTTKAYLTFVALDDLGKPTPVAPLAPQEEDEIRRFENARQRVEARKALKKKLR